LSETISPNSTLAHYTIVCKIGSGGMGEVYRARDSRLDREVAIKMLPVNFATDADRLKRFEQEARPTSALNHPNVHLGPLHKARALPFCVMARASLSSRASNSRTQT